MNRSFALSFAFIATVVQAEDTAARPDLPLWEIGVAAGGISQQAYPGADEQVSRTPLLPLVIYRGKVLRAGDGGAGLRAIRTDAFELDVSFAGSLSAGGKSLKAREGMPRLNSQVEFGPVARWFLNGRGATDRLTFELPLRGVFEARDLRRHRGMSLEPELSVDHRVMGGWSYGLSAGLLVGDRRLGATYYAVAPDEVLPDRAAYDAKAGLIAWRLKGRVSHRLTPDLRLFAFGRIDSVAGAANRDSPLVRRTTGASIGIGLTYTLKRSEAHATD
ncbi:MAG: MipA/OmpV family protein [Rubrivivax sp.]|nr:MAG: MipA/OmpV family protein [Rubrivivax sp.]